MNLSITELVDGNKPLALIWFGAPMPLSYVLVKRYYRRKEAYLAAAKPMPAKWRTLDEIARLVTTFTVSFTLNALLRCQGPD